MTPAPTAFAFFLASLPLPGLLLAAQAGLHRAGLGVVPFGFLALLLSLGIASATGLASAAAGVFSLPVVAALNVGLAALLAALGGAAEVREAFRVLSSRASLPRTGTAVAAALLLVAAGWLYARPYEHFVGGWDPGVYVNTGASIARTGAIEIRDGGLARLAPAVRELFLHRRRGLAMKYPGFVVRDADAGRVQPYFTHLYPVWIAILDAGLGPRAGLYAGALFMLLAVGALLLLGALLFDRGVGLAAACLFGLSIPAVWQARFPTAEPVALLFSLAGWVAVTLFLRERRAALAAVASFFLALALLAKITSALPLLLLLGASLILMAAAPAPGLAWLPGTLAAALLGVAPVMLALSREYADEVVRSVLVRRFGAPDYRWALAAAAGALSLCAAGLAARRFPRALRVGGSALAAAAGLYFYLLRPAVERSRDAGNLPELGWFVTPLVPALALLGLLAVLRRPAGGHPGRAQQLFAAVAAATTFAILHRKQVTPFYLWALRRYVPEVLPALALFAGVAVGLVRGREGSGASRVRELLAAGVVAVAVGLGLGRGSHLISHRDYAGALSVLERAAALLPDGAITLCADARLATPLQHVFGKETLALSDATPEKAERVADALAEMAAKGPPVFLAVYGWDFFTHRFGLEPAGTVPFDFPLLERSSSHYPSAIERFAGEIGVFRVVPFAPAAARRPDRIEIATAPFGLGAGFFAPERDSSGGKTHLFRWTGAEAGIEIPEPQDPGRAWGIELSLGGGRRPGVPDPSVEVLLDGRPVGSFRAGQAFATHRLVVPAGLVPGGRGYHDLALRTETFVPARSSPSRDERALGVMWEWAALRQPP